MKWFSALSSPFLSPFNQWQLQNKSQLYMCSVFAADCQQVSQINDDEFMTDI